MATFHFEPGADGKPQAVLPGAERESLAKVRASAPMRPRKPQKACDVGLFSDDANQLDLVSFFTEQSEQ
jgi:hypothetical protein